MQTTNILNDNLRHLMNCEVFIQEPCRIITYVTTAARFWELLIVSSIIFVVSVNLRSLFIDSIRPRSERRGRGAILAVTIIDIRVVVYNWLIAPRENVFQVGENLIRYLLVKLFHINQTKTIFLVRLRCSNRRLTRKLFHIRQTKLSGYSTSGRIKPSCYSSLLFRRLFHSALNLKVAIQRMGNGNTVLHTIPQQPQTITLSSGSVA